MHRLLIGIKRKADYEPTANNYQSLISKLKSLRYDEPFLSFGFTGVIIKSNK
jgi:hypothetical protein